MIFKQVCDASFLLDYAGTRFLINPAFGEKGMSELAVPLRELLDADAVIVTRLSGSCFDEAARQLLPRAIKIFVPNAIAQVELEGIGFTNVEVLTEYTRFQYLDVKKMPSFRSSQGKLKMDEKGCGVLISHPVLNSAYITGGSVFAPGVKELIQTYKPRLILIHVGGGQLLDKQRFYMNQEEIAAVHLTMPKARLIAVKTETLEADKLENSLYEHQMLNSVLIPEYGKEYRLI